MAKQTVTLQPGESKVVSFEATPTVAKIYHVAVDGLTGSFEAVEAPPLEATISDLVIEPKEVITGPVYSDIVWVYVTVTGSYKPMKVTLRCEIMNIDTGVTYASRSTSVSLGAYEQKQVQVCRWYIREPGNYRVTVNGLSDTFIGRDWEGIDLLSLPKDELHEQLVNGYTASVWWELGDSYRRALAIRIIEWWSVPLGRIKYIGQGEEGCRGGVFRWVGPPGDEPYSRYYMKRTLCEHNAYIRTALFSGKAVNTEVYYSLDGKEWHCIMPEDCFGLPAFSASIDKDGFYHAVAAIQVGKDPSRYGSYVFFQYNDPDAAGSWQVPPGSKIAICDIVDYSWVQDVYGNWVPVPIEIPIYLF